MKPTQYSFIVTLTQTQESVDEGRAFGSREKWEGSLYNLLERKFGDYSEVKVKQRRKKQPSKERATAE